MTTKELEYAIYKEYFNSSILTITNLRTVVKNECDVAVINKSRYLIGFELKISKADLLADFKKKHNHFCTKVRKMYFVIPEDMKKYKELIPEEYGIIVVQKGTWDDSFMKENPVRKTMYRCNKIREAKTNKCEKITDDEYINLCRLASMRYWTQKLNELKNEGLVKWEKLY